MFRWGLVLLCLFVSSLTTVAAVHAREIAGPPGIECSGYVHSDGDRDETQGDTDKATPHHHGGCSGNSAFLPVKPGPAPLFVALAARPLIPAEGLPGRWCSGPDLRPPIA